MFGTVNTPELNKMYAVNPVETNFKNIHLKTDSRPISLKSHKSTQIKRSLKDGVGSKINSILNQNQRRAYQMAVEGKSVFFSGGAGTGKSFVMKEIIQALKNLHKGKGQVVVTGTFISLISLNNKCSSNRDWCRKCWRLHSSFICRPEGRNLKTVGGHQTR